MRISPEQLWTIEDVAQFLRVKPSVIKYWVKNREIPYIKIGKNLRFDKQDIQEWVEERKQKDFRVQYIGKIF